MDSLTLDLRAASVRPHEAPRWNALMRTRHYLGFAKLCGPQLKQVAVCGERWLALLGWQATALHCATAGPAGRRGSAGRACTSSQATHASASYVELGVMWS